jgi:type IV fimbrial biogenesis protein FimT
MKKKNGYTILELMVTIGIIAILTAMAIPSFINWLQGYRLRSAANDVH